VNKATIITSQLPVEHWHAWIGDATIADAIPDRVMQHNHRFTLTGDSLSSARRCSSLQTLTLASVTFRSAAIAVCVRETRELEANKGQKQACL
jgi:hypothetical protein